MSMGQQKNSCSPRVLVAKWIEHLTSVQKVMGVIPVRDSEFFSVPLLSHVDQFTFHIGNETFIQLNTELIQLCTRY